MKPQSGKYKIKLKIDKIYNLGFPNSVGIMSEICKTVINQEFKTDNRNNWEWDDNFDGYIGWSACNAVSNIPNYKYLPYGLYCGWYDDTRTNNIFRKNKFVYCSNNENYKEGLPNIKAGDTIVLQYDSDASILSFSKENDNGKLDAYISNLPKDLTYYWFVGQYEGEMCLTVVE